MSQSETFPPAGPQDTLTGYPLSAQENSTGLLGPYSIGWSLAFMAYGVMLCQFFRYLQSGYFARDGVRRKALIWGVIILNTAVVVQLMENSFHWSTLQRRSTANLEKYRAWDSIGPVFSGILAFLVQGVFARRSFLLFERTASRYVFLVVIGIGMLVAVCGAFLDASLSFMSASGTLENAKPLTIQMTSGIWLWASAFVDVTNTATLCVLLKSRVKGWSSSTDGVIKSLMILGVETASYTSIFATVGAILSVSFRTVDDTNADLPATFWIPLPSLYAISLFTTLASRDRLAGQLSGSGNHQHHTFTLDVNGSDPTKNTQRRTLGGVHVQLNTAIHVDVGSGEQGLELEEKVASRNHEVL